jgi:hypothetical protein
VLAPTIKANSVYSEAYELRTLVVDMRCDSMDLCILNALQQGLTPTAAGSKCSASSAGFPTEMTYQISDVFGAAAAVRAPCMARSRRLISRWSDTMRL